MGYFSSTGSGSTLLGFTPSKMPEIKEPLGLLTYAKSMMSKKSESDNQESQKDSYLVIPGTEGGRKDFMGRAQVIDYAMSAVQSKIEKSFSQYNDYNSWIKTDEAKGLVTELRMLALQKKENESNIPVLDYNASRYEESQTAINQNSIGNKLAMRKVGDSFVPFSYRNLPSTYNEAASDFWAKAPVYGKNGRMQVESNPLYISKFDGAFDEKKKEFLDLAANNYFSNKEKNGIVNSGNNYDYFLDILDQKDNGRAVLNFITTMYNNIGTGDAKADISEQFFSELINELVYGIDGNASAAFKNTKWDDGKGKKGNYGEEFYTNMVEAYKANNLNNFFMSNAKSFDHVIRTWTTSKLTDQYMSWYDQEIAHTYQALEGDANGAGAKAPDVNISPWQQMHDLTRFGTERQGQYMKEYDTGQRDAKGQPIMKRKLVTGVGPLAADNDGSITPRFFGWFNKTVDKGYTRQVYNDVRIAAINPEVAKTFDEGLGIYKEKVGIKDAKPYPEFDRSKTSYFQSGLQDFQGVAYDAAVFENKGVLLIGHNGEQYALDANMDESGRFQNYVVNKFTSVMPRRLRVMDGFTLAIPVDQVGFLLSPVTTGFDSQSTLKKLSYIEWSMLPFTDKKAALDKAYGYDQDPGYKEGEKITFNLVHANKYYVETRLNAGEPVEIPGYDGKYYYVDFMFYDKDAGVQSSKNDIYKGNTGINAIQK